MQLLLTILVLAALQLSSNAQLKRLDIALDTRGRTGTISYYLFSSSNTNLLHKNSSDPEQTLKNHQAIAGCAGPTTLKTEAPIAHLSSSQGLSFEQKKTPSIILQNLPLIIKDGKPTIKSHSKQERHTLIGQTNTGQWFLAYTPPTSSAQLAQSLSNSAIKPKQVAIITRGNTASIWVNKQQYHPLYLRPLVQPKSVIILTK